MRRRLFAWLAFSIAVTAVATHLMVTHLHAAGRGPYIAASIILYLMFSMVANRISARIARGISELARVASELGAGNLKSRFQLHVRDSGDVVLLGVVFNDMADRIERQIADQRELLAGVSHELRTPLARIRLLIELLREGASPARLDEIEREVLEIDSLVGELLASSRMDFSAPSLRPLDAVDVAKRSLERAGLSADLVEATGKIDLQADPTLLARALANLIDNARKHGGGLVKLRVIASEEAVAFEVDDSGPGVPAEDPEQIFRPFAPRVDGQPREHGSLGLGLALVRRIAEAHGGRAYAQNRPEGGARVGFEITRSDDPRMSSA